MERAKREKYEQELRRLDAEFEELQRHWEQVPRFFVTALACPVVWIMYGFASGFVALLVSAALVGTRAYLIGIRKSENRWLHQSVAHEIEQDVQPALVARALPALA